MRNKLCLFMALLLARIGTAQSVLAPKFDKATMLFEGKTSKQATYLLRPVKKYGQLGKPLATLPSFLKSIVENKTAVLTQAQLTFYFTQKQLPQEAVGGDWQQGLSRTTNGIEASYFVIHDASNFVKDTVFPSTINTKAWVGNDLTAYQNFKYAHVFVNRLGESLTCNDFAKAVYGTKFEKSSKNPLVGDICVGTFLHIELIQPRIADAGKQNDAVAVSPGFTTEQYQKLALLYLTASARKKAWLIPTFHAVLDEGIPDAHDDPQHFDLSYFDAILKTTYEEIQQAKHE